MSHIQAGLGDFGFTLNGEKARLAIPRHDHRCADLLPELWQYVFRFLRHPARLVIVAGVCKSWREIARDAIVQLLIEAKRLTARARKIDIPRYDDCFEHGGRLFRYFHVINSNCCLQMQISPIADTDFGWSDVSVGPPWDVITPLPGFAACCACGNLVPIWRRSPARGVAHGDFFFCQEACIKKALQCWAKRHPIQ